MRVAHVFLVLFISVLYCIDAVPDSVSSNEQGVAVGDQGDNEDVESSGDNAGSTDKRAIGFQNKFHKRGRNVDGHWIVGMVEIDVVEGRGKGGRFRLEICKPPALALDVKPRGRQELEWRPLMYKLRKEGVRDEYLAYHLCEYLWRRHFKETNLCLFLRCAAEVYNLAVPPPEDEDA
ncbi:hypothetical protein RN001_014804 [Aquatica leii]|uniref:Uncharacterized protein n=1 Tax=Aquatica leii TaxID=1421715 RepID=A0AAN7SNA0_9COLE|nr:hypothetical protein RN001_014804 [Aquatica leii]